jgi:chromosomal replication initiation ATPase DnaA
MRTDPIALQLSKRLAQEWRGRDGEQSAVAWELLQIVCVVMDEDQEDVAGERRFAGFVQARFLWWACMRRYLGWSYPTIARFVDRHHTSIIHGINQVPNALVESIGPMMSNWHQERVA